MDTMDAITNSPLEALADAWLTRDWADHLDPETGAAYADEEEYLRSIGIYRSIARPNGQVRSRAYSLDVETERRGDHMAPQPVVHNRILKAAA